MARRKRTAPRDIKHPHLQYAADVAAGRIVTGDYVRRTCELTLFRHDEDEPLWEFRPDYAQPVLDFLAEVPHVEGEWAARGETLTLSPWQEFFVAEVWGWRGRADPRLRRYVQSYLEVGKKNGKTALCAGLELYELLYGDARAQVYSAATKEDQAMLSWSVAKLMVGRMPDDLVQDVKIDHRRIEDTTDGSYLVALSGNPHDGTNPSFVLYDECAAVTRREQVEVLTDAFGARQGAGIVFATTASKHRNTIWREKRAAYASSLKRGELPDRTFGLLYCIDEEDKPGDESKWPKANPNLGVSKFMHFMRKQWDDAQDSPGAVPDFMRKQLNVYVGAAESWLQPKFWEACEARRIVREGQCYVGIDMGATDDLCAVARLWDRGGARIDVDWRCWVAEGAVLRMKDEELQRLYFDAVKSKTLIIVPDEIVDYDEIEGYIRESCDLYDVQQIGHDPYRATSMFNGLATEGYPVMRVPQTRLHMGPAKARMEGYFRKRKLRYRPNAFVRWMFENTHVRPDTTGRGNDVLCKGENDQLKIDAIIAAAIGCRCMDAGATAPEPSFALVSF